MENNQDNQQNSKSEKDDSQNVVSNNPSEHRPNEEEQNDTGFTGTTNSISQSQQDSDEYKPAIEDTMIGYDGDESDLDMDLSDGNPGANNTHGVDDND